MLDTSEHQTLMYQEAKEASARVQGQVARNEPGLRDLGQRLRRTPPPYVMICARGSSSNAGLYARYLIETQLGVPVMPIAPSVSSVFGIRQKLDEVLFLAISQSGESPDILSAAQAAKDGGALVVCVVNNEKSPLAVLSDIVIPIHAGQETSVAATKTFICTLSAIAQMAAHWGQNASLIDELKGLPDKLEQAFKLKWEIAIESLEACQSLFVVSRGLGLSTAKEAALKFKETCSIHAEAFSAAEVKHGPMALVKKGFPVMLFSTGDKSQASIDDVAKLFTSRSAQILWASTTHTEASFLPSIETITPELRPITSIQTFYRFANALSLRRGLDPDNPEYLSKVTKTV